MLKHACLIALGMFAVSAAAAQEATPSTGSPRGGVSDPKNPAEKKICHSDMETGSHMPGPRICMTKAQWAEQSRNAQGFTSGAQNYGAAPPTQGGR